MQNCPNYFPVNVSVLAVVFRQQISKNRQCQGNISILGKMNSFPLRLESILVFLIYQMQDTSRKIGSKVHGKKLMINWELKKVLPYVMLSF